MKKTNQTPERMMRAKISEEEAQTMYLADKAAVESALAQQAHGAEVNQLLSVVSQAQGCYMDTEDALAAATTDAEKLLLIRKINQRLGKLCGDTLPG